jgi:hypothetical protein
MKDKLYYGEKMMNQVFKVQKEALERGMEFDDYIKGVNDGTIKGGEARNKPLEKIVLLDANAEAEKDHQARMAKIGTSGQVLHNFMGVLYKGIDFAMSKVEQLVPVMGKVLKHGWESFAPYGASSYQEGSFTDKAKRFGKKLVDDAVGDVANMAKDYGADLAKQAGESVKGLAGDAATAAKKMLGFGKTRASRRKAMEKLMDEEVELHGGRSRAKKRRVIKEQ